MTPDPPRVAHPHGRLFALLLGLLLAAWPVSPAFAGDPDDRAVLVFSKTAGFRHASIPDGVAALRRLGERRGFRVDATEDSAWFTDDRLASYDAVLFLSTTGDILDDDQQAAFERYIRAGGGFVGVHAAADTEYDWPWFGRLVGAYFQSHPAIQEATIHVCDLDDPSTRHLDAEWVRHDEWYDYRDNPRGRVHVLMTLDESTYENGRMGHDHPIAWRHTFEGGRAWYTGGGHTSESFAEPDFMTHIAGGVAWAAGWKTIPDDAGPTRDACYEKVVLDDFVSDPMELAVAPDGRVIFVERAGIVKVWRPADQTTIVAGYIPVFTELEDGLLGVTLDPDFSTNGWIYLYYSPPGPDLNRLSRFTMNGDRLRPGSEVVLLDVPVQRLECCHAGGSLAFDADGNLYLSTGDNTSPFASDGYSPIDEREGRMPWDAQKGPSDPYDLRGKILRITPRADGGYDIPDGNLFPPDGSQGAPEVYVMGCRNPYRINIDPVTGALHWGEVGPDAGGPNPARGPAGHDEFNRAMSAGNFGWPYFIGPNLPYRDYDFESRRAGDEFNPENLVNRSPNASRDGVVPPPQPAWIAYPYAASTQYPELGSGGRCAMGGPTYRRPESAHPNALPAYYDGMVLIYEWARNWIRAVRHDDGEIMRIEPFLASMSFIRPMDMEIGPDGRLYMIEWGTGFGGGNPDAQIVRIDYHASGVLPPHIEMNATPRTGAASLTVTLDSAGTAARAAPGSPLTYAWDFDDDGVVDSTDPTATARYETPGVYQARLTVEDAAGARRSATIPVIVGNTAPDVAIEWPPDGGVADFGEWIEIRVRAEDAEDGAPDPETITVQPYLGHDTHAHPLHIADATALYVQTSLIDGHGGDADLFTVLEARYEDSGAASLPTLTGRSQVILQPRRKQAEHSAASSNVRLEKSSDGDGQAAVLASGGWTSYAPVHFHGVDALRIRAAASGPGRLEVRLDDPDAAPIGGVDLAPSGGVTLPAGPTPFRVEFFENGGGAGVIWRMIAPGGPKQVVPADLLTADGAPGVRVRFFDLDKQSPSVLPDFSTLTSYQTSRVKNINVPSTGGDFLDSGRADTVAAVFEGEFNAPVAGEYIFMLESDDGSRLWLGDRLAVNNDGLHGMKEVGPALRWTSVDIPTAEGSGPHTVYLRWRGSGEAKINWIEFVGPGVGVNERSNREAD